MLSACCWVMEKRRFFSSLFHCAHFQSRKFCGTFFISAMVQRMEDGGRDLVNDIAPAGLPKFYTIPKTADLTQTLGYKAEQIISKNRDKDAARSDQRRDGKSTARVKD